MKYTKVANILYDLKIMYYFLDVHSLVTLQIDDE